LSFRHLSLAILLVGLVVAAGLVITSGAGWRVGGRALAGIVAVALASVPTNDLVFSRFFERLQWKTLWPEPYVQQVETRSGVITVARDGRIYGGGEYDGAFRIDLADDINGIRRAFLAGAVHPR